MGFSGPFGLFDDLQVAQVTKFRRYSRTTVDSPGFQKRSFILFNVLSAPKRSPVGPSCNIFSLGQVLQDLKEEQLGVRISMNLVNS